MAGTSGTGQADRGQEGAGRRDRRGAAEAIHLMTNTALTGATFDTDGGQQLVS
jgi:hypothetical protein